MEAGPPSPVALAALTNATYDRIAPAFAERTANNERVRARLTAFVAALPPAPDGRAALVLDAGCGPGRDCHTFWREHGLRVIGVDFSRAMLDFARQRVGDEVALARMDLRRLGFVSEAFDGVWCAAALLHLTRRDAPDAVAELARVLRPGGLLHLSLKEGVGEAITGEEIGEARFFTYYEEAEVRALVEGADLTVEHAEVTEPQADRGQQRWVQLFARKPEKETGPPCA